MLVPKLDARYVHMKNALITTGKYPDGSLALLGEDEDEDGYPNYETFSINLSAYGLTPPEGHVYIKGYSESEGVASALAEVGIVEIIEPITFGPFSLTAHLVKVLIMDEEATS